jgi:hypothetical protein
MNGTAALTGSADTRPRLGSPAALSPAETVAAGIAAAATAGFAAYGLTTGAPSTVGYLLTVAVLAALLGALRRSPLPGPVAVGLALLVAAHLAGGLVPVGHDVLYNAALGWRGARYDHLVHGSAIFLGTIVLWSTVLEPAAPAPEPSLVAVCVIAALGLGALNEMVEFLTTLAHQGSHVGGYDNTGWDLVSNTVGGIGAGLFLRRPRAMP